MHAHAEGLQSSRPAAVVTGPGPTWTALQYRSQFDKLFSLSYTSVSKRRSWRSKTAARRLLIMLRIGVIVEGQFHEEI